MEDWLPLGCIFLFQLLLTSLPFSSMPLFSVAGERILWNYVGRKPGSDMVGLRCQQSLFKMPIHLLQMSMPKFFEKPSLTKGCFLLTLLCFWFSILSISFTMPSLDKSEKCFKSLNLKIIEIHSMLKGYWFFKVLLTSFALFQWESVCFSIKVFTEILLLIFTLQAITPKYQISVGSSFLEREESQHVVWVSCYSATFYRFGLVTIRQNCCWSMFKEQWDIANSKCLPTSRLWQNPKAKEINQSWNKDNIGGFIEPWWREDDNHNKTDHSHELEWDQTISGWQLDNYQKDPGCPWNQES